ncbi:putative calcyclin-binding protein [Apostichopus japonicus]|uniref:Calcyclin-binding protein n=1 Tax=Stichopus japonicus TaxID=307972 RepID=A0A2G8KB96_STIJA|nr:putative calcyclin-binding protein [Apostichopus japonicus]
MSVDELHLDIQELQRLLEFTNRPNVQAALTKAIEGVEEKLANLKVAQEAKNLAKAESEDGKPKTSHLSLPVSKIRTYGWDQSEKFVKLYITLKGIHSLPKENIILNYSKKSLKLVVRNLGNKNMELIINNLAESIDADSSSHKVKADELVLLLRKASKTQWSALTQKDVKPEEKVPPYNPSEDPSAGIMNMMKKMYDEGDDEMKRTIAKAWTEGRDKSGGGMNF